MSETKTEKCVDCGGYGMICAQCYAQVEESGCEECGSPPSDCPVCGGTGTIEVAD